MNINIHRYFKYIVQNSFAGSNFCPIPLRRIIYNLCGNKIQGSVGRNTFLGYGPKGKLTMGGGSYCNAKCFFDLSDDVVIGKDCSIGMGCTFITSTHEIGCPQKRGGTSITKRITVGDGVWVGGKVSILPGVNIGDGVVIGTGAVVNKDLEPNCLYAGVPAKLIKRLSNE